VSAPSLAQTQRLFSTLVTRPGPVPDTADARALVAPQPRLDAIAALDVYAEAYFFRLLEILGLQYERTRAAMGDARFRVLVQDYLAAQPPRHFSAGETGDRLPQFLAGHPVSAGHPEWIDVALVERRELEVFEAAEPDTEPLTVDDLGALPADGLDRVEIRLIPAHARLQLAYPEKRLLLWRPGTIVRTREVDRDDEWRALAAAARGATFAELGEIVADGRELDEATAALGALLVAWVGDRLVTTTAPGRTR
jgi:hypothetical protein